MRKLFLAIFAVTLTASALATAGEFEDRRNADYMRQHAEYQKQFMALTVKRNQEYREKVYRWTYQFTGGSPLAAQNATCRVEMAWCHYSMCLFSSDNAKTVRLDELVNSASKVRQCEVKLPAPHDLVCRLNDHMEPDGPHYKSVTEATCYDKNSQLRTFRL